MSPLSNVNLSAHIVIPHNEDVNISYNKCSKNYFRDIGFILLTREFGLHTMCADIGNEEN